MNHRFVSQDITGRTCPYGVQAKISYSSVAIPILLGSFQLFLPILIFFMKFFLAFLFSGNSFFSSAEGLRFPCQLAIHSNPSFFHFWFYFIFSISSAFDSLKQSSLAWWFFFLLLIQWLINVCLKFMSFSLNSERQSLKKNKIKGHLWCVCTCCWRLHSEKSISFPNNQKIQDGWIIRSFSFIACWFRFEALGLFWFFLFLINGDLEMLAGVQCLLFKFCMPMCLDRAVVLWKWWHFYPLGKKRKLLSRVQRSLVTLKEIFMKWKATTIKSCNFCS